MIAKTPTMTKGRAHKSGCACKWCQPDYLKKAPEDIVGRSAPCLAVRLPQGEADAFKALCARLGEPYGAVLRREIRRLVEEDLDAQALGRMTAENQQNKQGAKKMQGHSELLERSLDENGSGEARLYRATHPKFANQTFYITLSDGSTGFTAWQGETEEEARKAFARYTH